MITANNITIIIPVKNNQKGIDFFLQELLMVTDPLDYCHQIIIVDNNSSQPIIIPSYIIPIKVIKCVTPGPAAARNLGAKYAETDWCLFTDSDCIPTPTTISGYCISVSTSEAYQGMYMATSGNIFSHFYQKYNSCNPLCIVDQETMINRVHMWQPAFLVTANCLIATHLVNDLQFDEGISLVASEDLELGVRIKEQYPIHICRNSIIYHTVEDDWLTLIDRFTRYGRGCGYVINKYPHLFHKHGPFCAMDRVCNEYGINKLTLMTMNMAFIFGFLINLPEQEELDDYNKQK